ncbi:MAG TPA: DUF1289 domain-containing protein [Epsilonproteobacteria bacterium]|nr:DUF1289 domain-containing protein [Campylobacterota bacterium]
MPSIEKPCIRKCCLNKEDICMGCFRSLNDMKIWHKASVEEKRHMLQLASKRKEVHRSKFC